MLEAFYTYYKSLYKRDRISVLYVRKDLTAGLIEFSIVFTEASNKSRGGFMVKSQKKPLEKKNSTPPPFIFNFPFKIKM